MNRDEFDHSHLRAAVSAPGIDSRQWVSYGTVENATGGTSPVDFTQNVGPLVNVRLQPSGIPVRCRIAAFTAGGGETEYHPYSAGDEVLVVVPHGDERSVCVVVGRLNNSLDTWPGVVANQDLTTNNFSGRRTIPNYVWEVANGWLLANTTTHAQLSMSMVGEWMMADGEGDFVSLSSNGIALKLGDGSASMFLQTGTGQIHFTFGTTGQLLLDGTSFFLTTPGSVYMGTTGAPPTDHVLTIEAFLNFMVAFMGILGGPGATSVWSPGTDSTETVRGAVISGLIPIAAADKLALPQFTAALQTALLIPRVPLVSPGVGVAGFVV